MGEMGSERVEKGEGTPFCHRFHLQSTAFRYLVPRDGVYNPGNRSRGRDRAGCRIRSRPGNAFGHFPEPSLALRDRGAAERTNGEEAAHGCSCSGHDHSLCPRGCGAAGV
ncbi:hypothetical protein GCM10022227_30670 [Streptomyces sedi]